MQSPYRQHLRSGLNPGPWNYEDAVQKHVGISRKSFLEGFILLWDFRHLKKYELNQEGNISRPFPNKIRFCGTFITGLGITSKSLETQAKEKN